MSNCLASSVELEGLLALAGVRLLEQVGPIWTISVATFYPDFEPQLAECRLTPDYQFPLPFEKRSTSNRGDASFERQSLTTLPPIAASLAPTIIYSRGCGRGSSRGSSRFSRGPSTPVVTCTVGGALTPSTSARCVRSAESSVSILVGRRLASRLGMPH